MAAIKAIRGTCRGRDSDGEVSAPADLEDARGPKLSEDLNFYRCPRLKVPALADGEFGDQERYAGEIICRRRTSTDKRVKSRESHKDSSGWTGCGDG